MKKISCAFVIILLAVILTLTACGALGNGADEGEDSADIVYTSIERKIIYTASFTIVTKDVAASAALVENSLKDDEWFDEITRSSNDAYFKARVKTSRLDAYIKEFSDNTETFKNYQRTATDISLSYYDTQGRIDAFEAERTRLIALMGEGSTTMSDLIVINARLSAVELELKKLNGELFVLDSKLDYSTVVIRVEAYSYGWIALIVIPGSMLLTGMTVLIVCLYYKKKSSLNKTNVTAGQ